MPTSALALLALLVLAACAAPADRGTPPEADAPPPAGLSADEAASLTGLGIPVVVPSDPGGFRVVGLEATADGVGRSAGGYAAFYAVRYRRADGACFSVSGGNDGFGGFDVPIVSTDVRVPGLGRTVRLYQASQDPGATSAMNWGPGTVVSDEIPFDGASSTFRSAGGGGCRPLSLEESAPIVRSLVRLGPASRPPPGAETGSLGPFAPADDVLEGTNAASSPELAADAVARRYGTDADRVTVDVLSETSYEATALVTALGLRDDSVRDERLRLTYTPYNGTWELTAAARQVRCQLGRGHQDWGPEACF